MTNSQTFAFWLIVLLMRVAASIECVVDEEEFKEFLENCYEATASASCSKSVIAQWNKNTDVNNKTKYEIALNSTLESALLAKQNWNNIFKHLNPDDYFNENIKRQVKLLKILGQAVLSEDKFSKLTTAVAKMTDIYSTARICPYRNKECDLKKEGLSLIPDLEAIFTNSVDYNELVYVWKVWRDTTGAKIQNLYQTYVELSNEAAIANGFKDNGEMWRDSFESPTFIKDMDDLWSQVEPLYSELHKYVAQKLKGRFGDKLDISDGLIPAHILGNMWAQNWGNIAQLVRPFPRASKADLDAALREENYTILKMFQTADQFYKSLGLMSNEISYDTSKGALIEKPSDGREVACHPDAWDFCDGVNFRIKMCTKTSQKDFITIHQEMGHIQYFLQYAHQPSTFRFGANPGFHDAIGGTVALSASTPQHLQKINLLKDYRDSREASINALMDKALAKVAFLPFGLLVDKWRWDVFSGQVKPKEWNSHWWYYRAKYQKVKPPVPRSDDFDPGAEYHVAAGHQYISHFVSCVLQFQLHKSLCIAAGQYDPGRKDVPLHECDFYESSAAGTKLSKGLSLGASRHWSDVLELMTGERALDVSAILEYFDPLYKFLKEQNNSK